MPRTVKDINDENIQVLTEDESTAALAAKADAINVYSREAVDEKLAIQATATNEQLNRISEKVSVWIHEHNMREASSGCDCGQRTRIIYRDADQNELVKLIPGDVISTAEAGGQTTIKWVSDKYDTEQTEIIDGVIVVMHREHDCGNDDYELMQNLPFVKWEDDAGTEHKDYIKGDITKLLKDVIAKYEILTGKPKVKFINRNGDEVVSEIPANPDVLDLTDIGVGKIKYIDRDGNEQVKDIGPELDITDIGVGTVTYLDKEGNEVVKNIGPKLDIKDLGVGKIKYFNRKGETIIKDIHAADEILDITDLGVVEKVYKIKYTCYADETCEETEAVLRAKEIIEYIYDESTKTTLVKYTVELDDGTVENREITYPGDVTEIKIGFADVNGTSSYRELENLPTITWEDRDTGRLITHVLRGDVTDDVTELLEKISSGSALFFTNPETGEEEELVDNIDMWLADVIPVSDVEDLWNNTQP